jgi:hypothetical protein
MGAAPIQTFGNSMETGQRLGRTHHAADSIRPSRHRYPRRISLAELDTGHGGPSFRQDPGEGPMTGTAKQIGLIGAVAVALGIGDVRRNATRVTTST